VLKTTLMPFIHCVLIIALNCLALRRFQIRLEVDQKKIVQFDFTLTDLNFPYSV